MLSGVRVFNPNLKYWCVALQAGSLQSSKCTACYTCKALDVQRQQQQLQPKPQLPVRAAAGRQLAEQQML
jgi:hypothetical protein